MSSRISDAVRKLFPNDFADLAPAKRRWQAAGTGFFKKRWFLLLIVAVGVLLCYSFGYYYNRFVTLETQVLTDRAQIDAQLQMRKDLLINLAKTVIDYAEHEREMFKYMADQRLKSLKTAEKPTMPKAGTDAVEEIEQLRGRIPQDMLDQLIALAENYPELKLSSNFEKLMEALVNIEKSIVEQRMKYNESCNKFGTYIRKFPQNIFAFLYGFEMYPFEEVDTDVELFNRVEY